MAYILAAGVFALVVLGVGILRSLTKSGPPASGQFVTQDVLMRIRAEYRDIH
jgi:hypothetical protein